MTKRTVIPSQLFSYLVLCKHFTLRVSGNCCIEIVICKRAVSVVIMCNVEQKDILIPFCLSLNSFIAHSSHTYFNRYLGFGLTEINLFFNLSIIFMSFVSIFSLFISFMYSQILYLHYSRLLHTFPPGISHSLFPLYHI